MRRLRWWMNDYVLLRRWQLFVGAVVAGVASAALT